MIHFLPALHIPDGFLNVPTVLVGWLLTLIFVSIAVRQEYEDRHIPLMGILAAFVFAAQMINFPVAGGTSGHLLGGALVAVLVGPWAGILVMTSVVAMQALLFQDGGLIVMGFNIFNMGILTVFIGYSLYQLLAQSLIGVFVGAWVGVEAAALATSLQLAASDTSPLDVVLPAMLGVHALIGIGEGLITIGALTFIKQTRPDLLSIETPAHRYKLVAAGLVIALAVVLMSPLASPDPDGLERVAENQNFLREAQDAAYTLLPDYTVPFIENEKVTTVAAGIIGVLLLAGAGLALSRK